MTPRRSSNRPQNGRRTFIWTLAMAPFAWALGSMLTRVRARYRPADVLVPANVPQGLSVCGPVVVNRGADGSMRAYAARCTHLGCRLDRVVNGMLVCPCHGSRFASDGSVLVGPATRPLARLRVMPDAPTGGWIVDAG
jgi:nitrite reductase/ring-hydroxylating ferredoxin subunit